MAKLIVFAIVCIAALVAAEPKPGPGVLPVAAAYTAPAVVTAQSSQVFARNYNGLVAAAPVAPFVAAAPYVRAPLVAAPAPIVRSAPLVAAAPFAYAAPHYGYHPYSPYVAHPNIVV